MNLLQDERVSVQAEVDKVVALDNFSALSTKWSHLNDFVNA